MKTNYTIKETAIKTGLSEYTLRYYEKTGLITANRAPNGHRQYSEDDIHWIAFLICLRSTGMPISEIKKFVDLSEIGDSTISDRKKLLEKHKTKVVFQRKELDTMLGKLDWKINYYGDMEKKMKNCEDEG